MSMWDDFGSPITGEGIRLAGWKKKYDDESLRQMLIYYADIARNGPSFNARSLAFGEMLEARYEMDRRGILDREEEPPATGQQKDIAALIWEMRD